MAEILVSVVCEALIGKLFSIASDEISLVCGVRDELSKLQITLKSIQSVLTDAERQQAEQEKVKLWLQNLKNAVHEAEDILDELEYDAHKREIEVRKRDKVKNFFSDSNPLMFCHKIAHKIKDINQMLDEVSKDKDQFSFNVSENTTCEGSSRNKETHLLEDVSTFVGREKEKSEIIDWLLGQQIYRNLLILPMGGVGKTALARTVYSDDVVRNHFEIRLWVCASDQYPNQLQVLKQLVESISGRKEDWFTWEIMVNILREKFRNMQYLIVLDGVRKYCPSEWKYLLDVLLLLGAQGSKVIITSRDVSPMSTLCRYSLDGLCEDDCWTMLEKIVFGP